MIGWRFGPATIAFALLAVAPFCPAAAQTRVHGADSLFAAATVKLAWAIEKGAAEDTTMVVIRAANTAGAYRHIRVEGLDPFTKERTTLVAGQAFPSQIDLKIPRARFAQFPSAEILLFRSDSAAANDLPELIVFYLGVPDTTPEFATAQGADAYLARMLGAAN